VAGSLDQFHAWQSDWLHSFEKENNINVQNYSTPYRVALLYDHDVLYSYFYGAMKRPSSQPVIREKTDKNILSFCFPVFSSLLSLAAAPT